MTQLSTRTNTTSRDYRLLLFQKVCVIPPCTWLQFHLTLLFLFLLDRVVQLKSLWESDRLWVVSCVLETTVQSSRRSITTTSCKSDRRNSHLTRCSIWRPTRSHCSTRAPAIWCLGASRDTMRQSLHTVKLVVVKHIPWVQEAPSVCPPSRLV